MALATEVKYFNSFWLKKIADSNAGATQFKAVYPGTNTNGYNLGGGVANTPSGVWPAGGVVGTTVINLQSRNWTVEESRIRGGYNNTQVSLGVKAFIEEEVRSIRLDSGLIYSGIYNSRTGVNETNQFPTGEEITKQADPQDGSIQHLYADDNDLTVFQENKVSRALIDKDAIYNAEGGGSVTSTKLVIGQIVPYAGRYGISDNPESFAYYGFRKYFTDRYRGVVCRLSRDGITEISQYGMFDYFRDTFGDLPLEKQSYETRGQSIFSGTNTFINIGLIGGIVNPPTFTFPQTVYGALPDSGTAIPLAGGSGLGATADISIDAAGNVSYSMVSSGLGYNIGDVLQIPAGALLSGVNPQISSSPLTSSDVDLTGNTEYPNVGAIVSIKDYATGLVTETTAHVVASGLNSALPTGSQVILELSEAVTFSQGDEFIFTVNNKLRIKGAWDIHNQAYTLCINQSPDNFVLPTNNYGQEPTVGFETLQFDDTINGWVSFYSFRPSVMFSLKNKFYSVPATLASLNETKSIYEHYVESIDDGIGGFIFNNKFYDEEFRSSITFVFNPQPSIMKNFQTISYEGSNGWSVESIKSDFTGYLNVTDFATITLYPIPENTEEYQDENGRTQVRGAGNFPPPVAIPSYGYGYYDTNPDSSQFGTPQQMGFWLKENRYVANLINNSKTMPKEVIIGANGVISNSMSGLKGYFTTVKMVTDIPYVPLSKELYAVATKYVPSSY